MISVASSRAASRASRWLYAMIAASSAARDPCTVVGKRRATSRYWVRAATSSPWSTSRSPARNPAVAAVALSRTVPRATPRSAAIAAPRVPILSRLRARWYWAWVLSAGERTAAKAAIASRCRPSRASAIPLASWSAASSGRAREKPSTARAGESVAARRATASSSALVSGAKERSRMAIASRASSGVDRAVITPSNAFRMVARVAASAGASRRSRTAVRVAPRDS